jgi:hypothetical protein
MSHRAANESIVLTLTILEVCPVVADVATARCSRTPRISAAKDVRIPIQSGQGFRFDPGHHSDLIPATVPK